MNTYSYTNTKQNRIDNLELGGTGQGNQITYVYHNKEEFTQHPKFYGDENGTH